MEAYSLGSDRFPRPPDALPTAARAIEAYLNATSVAAAAAMQATIASARPGPRGFLRAARAAAALAAAQRERAERLAEARAALPGCLDNDEVCSGGAPPVSHPLIHQRKREGLVPSPRLPRVPKSCGPGRGLEYRSMAVGNNRHHAHQSSRRNSFLARIKLPPIASCDFVAHGQVKYLNKAGLLPCFTDKDCLGTCGSAAAGGLFPLFVILTAFLVMNLVARSLCPRALSSPFTIPILHPSCPLACFCPLCRLRSHSVPA
jgi:hypothetical protein